MVLSQVVGVPLFFDLLVIHSSEGIASLAAYSSYLVRPFPNRVSSSLITSLRAVMKAFLITRSPG